MDDDIGVSVNKYTLAILPDSSNDTETDSVPMGGGEGDEGGDGGKNFNRSSAQGKKSKRSPKTAFKMVACWE